jgi:hypothetical protein
LSLDHSDHINACTVSVNTLTAKIKLRLDYKNKNNNKKKIAFCCKKSKQRPLEQPPFAGSLAFDTPLTYRVKTD